jgi:hypothetical protein
MTYLYYIAALILRQSCGIHVELSLLINLLHGEHKCACLLIDLLVRGMGIEMDGNRNERRQEKLQFFDL